VKEQALFTDVELETRGEMTHKGHTEVSGRAEPSSLATGLWSLGSSPLSHTYTILVPAFWIKKTKPKEKIQNDLPKVIAKINCQKGI
jgi:hypothetical protein